MMAPRILVGDCRQRLREVEPETVQCCVTSPPYFGLRDYGVAGQMGLEETPQAYVEQLVEVFREVRRALRPDGVLWLNLGDSYAGGGCGERDPERWPKQSRNDHMPRHMKKRTGLKPKDLIGIPWMVAFALRVGAVALREGRAFLGVELNPDYIAMAEERMRVQTGLPFARGLA